MRVKLPVIPFESPPDWWVARLNAWLGERALDQTLKKVAGPAVEEVSKGGVLPSGLVRSYDCKLPKSGEIRILSSDVMPADHPVYLAVLSTWDKGKFLVAPFSPYAEPATPGEWLVGRKASPLKTLSLWNARVVSAETLRRGWVAAKLNRREVLAALAVYRHALSGEPLPGALVKQVGPPILLPDDPRVAYQQEQMALMASLAAAPVAVEAKVPGSLSAIVAALASRVRDYCRKIDEAFTWQPVPELAMASLKGAVKGERVAVVLIGKDGQRRVVARVEPGIPLPSARACWRLSPAKKKLAGKRFAVFVEKTSNILAVGRVNKAGGRFEVEGKAKRVPVGATAVIVLVE